MAEAELPDGTGRWLGDLTARAVASLEVEMRDGLPDTADEVDWGAGVHAVLGALGRSARDALRKGDVTRGQSVVFAIERVLGSDVTDPEFENAVAISFLEADHLDALYQGQISPPHRVTELIAGNASPPDPTGGAL